jgi:predicted phosphodiesterase
MMIHLYSDLHLEFNHGWTLPKDLPGDVVILAGDILTFNNFNRLVRFLQTWDKPVIFVPGNHEYYTKTSMGQAAKKFNIWLAKTLPHVILLTDAAISLGGVHFFGGTMWTDFDNLNEIAMAYAKNSMNDFLLVHTAPHKIFTPEVSVVLHKKFKKKLIEWFESDLIGPRIVISHHAPVIGAHTQFEGSPLVPAFNSLDMLPLIEKYQPDYWFYGHTHECDEQQVGKTKIISNQRGYPRGVGHYECEGFEPDGKSIQVSF